MDVYCARSLKQQSAPLRRIVLIRAKQFVIVLTNALCLVEKKQISIIQSLVWFATRLKSANRTAPPMQYLKKEIWNNCRCHTCIVGVQFTNDHGYVPFIVNTSRSFPHSRLTTGFVTRLTRRVPLVEQELLTLSEHPSSPPVFSGVRVTRSLVLYVCFVDRCLSFCTFFFWPLCCLLFFNLWILITSLVSSNSSYY